MVALGTGLLLLLIKFRLFTVWKVWFLLAVGGSLAVALAVIIPEIYAFLIGFALAYFKIYRPHVILHNLTEVLMYAGITILVAPLFTVFWMSMLLLVISAYDAIAVWKSKHMIKMAQAQAESKMFAGLLIPYSKKPKFKKKEIDLEIPEGFEEKDVKSAILGGGDIAFPLLFSGSVMTFLIQEGLTRTSAYFNSVLVSLFAGIALFILLIRGKKDTFYPAMPFISLGCFVGFAIVWAINFL
jgi:presenilin-like A22 family membrane protease